MLNLDEILLKVESMIRLQKENIRQEFTILHNEMSNEYKEINRQVCQKVDDRILELTKRVKEVECQAKRTERRISQSPSKRYPSPIKHEPVTDRFLYKSSQTTSTAEVKEYVKKYDK